jgi:hypothetical protein
MAKATPIRPVGFPASRIDDSANWLSFLRHNSEWEIEKAISEGLISREKAESLLKEIRSSSGLESSRNLPSGNPNRGASGAQRSFTQGQTEGVKVVGEVTSTPSRVSAKATPIRPVGIPVQKSGWKLKKPVVPTKPLKPQAVAITGVTSQRYLKRHVEWNNREIEIRGEPKPPVQVPPSTGPSVGEGTMRVRGSGTPKKQATNVLRTAGGVPSVWAGGEPDDTLSAFVKAVQKNQPELSVDQILATLDSPNAPKVSGVSPQHLWDPSGNQSPVEFTEGLIGERTFTMRDPDMKARIASLPPGVNEETVEKMRRSGKGTWAKRSPEVLGLMGATRALPLNDKIEIAERMMNSSDKRLNQMGREILDDSLNSSISKEDVPYQSTARKDNWANDRGDMDHERPRYRPPVEAPPRKEDYFQRKARYKAITANLLAGETVVTPIPAHKRRIASGVSSDVPVKGMVERTVGVTKQRLPEGGFSSMEEYLKHKELTKDLPKGVSVKYVNPLRVVPNDEREYVPYMEMPGKERPRHSKVVSKSVRKQLEKETLFENPALTPVRSEDILKANSRAGREVRDMARVADVGGSVVPAESLLNEHRRLTLQEKMARRKGAINLLAKMDPHGEAGAAAKMLQKNMTDTGGIPYRVKKLLVLLSKMR